MAGRRMAAHRVASGHGVVTDRYDAIVVGAHCSGSPIAMLLPPKATTPLSVAETARKRYGRPLRVIKGVGGDPPIEQPKAFLGALDAVFEHP